MHIISRIIALSEFLDDCEISGQRYVVLVQTHLNDPQRGVETTSDWPSKNSRKEK